MTLNIHAELKRLVTLKTPQLKARYAELFGEPTRCNNRPYLIKRIAWRLQANEEGDLSERARQRAMELAISDMAHPAPANDFEVSDLVLPDCLFIRVREKLEKVLFDDILFIESDGRYAMLHTHAGRKFAIRIPLGDLEAKLPAERFARIHRGYLIQMKWMQSVDLHDMTVKVKDRDLPLGKSFREQVLERLRQL